MSRNVFESLGAMPSNQYGDDSESSEESDLSDDEEMYMPTPTVESSDSSCQSSSSSDSESESGNEGSTQPSSTGQTNENNIILGKDKKTQWNSRPFPENRTPLRNILKIPRNRIPYTEHVTSPSEAFELFIDERMVQLIAECTNKEGKRVKGNKWKPTDATEIKTFIACLLHTGSMHQNKTSLEILFNFVEGNPLIRAAFSKNRFSTLLNHVRFDDKETRTVRQQRDKFTHIRELWNMFHMNLARHYHPGQNITIDEQLVPFRGRCPFLQYIPSKPDKYGMKIFWACDSESMYPLRGFPYLGKEQTGARPVTANNVAIGSNTVLKLSEDFKGTGRNVTCDNFFTTLDLAETLVKDNLTIVGTVRRNKTFLPVNMQAKKALPLSESAFLFRKHASLVSYQSKKEKNVVLLSTMHSTPEISETDRKPEIVLYYNKTKGGVDAMDQMAHAFTVKRKTKRWPLVMFFNMIDLSTVAARVIWKSKEPGDRLSHEDNRQQFIIAVAREMVFENIQRRSVLPTLNKAVKQNIDTVIQTLKPTPTSASIQNQNKRPRSDESAQPRPPKQKRCSLCPSKKDRKTKSCCSKCHLHICKDHTVLICTNCSE